MRWPIVTMSIADEDDVVTVRQRARRVAELVGFGPQDQTRVATAVSEIARNAYGYAGGGRAEYGIGEDRGAPALLVRISDRGPGIADLPAVLEGRYRSSTGLGIGITGARRLMDGFQVGTQAGQGTTVTLAKRLPAGAPALTGPKVAQLGQTLARGDIGGPHVAIREQNRELLRSLAELVEREEEAKRLNRELAETNRGVVALHAELEAQAGQLREAGTDLENQIVARTVELAEANARLRAEAVDRERMEDSLRQSQKMEAVGQLTGGIAHDFNNLLTGIVGSLDLARRRLAEGRTDRLARYLDTALSSANRAAALTHRLLAFARRQPLDPKLTDANALIAGMHDLLRRTINESIDLRIVGARDLWRTLCDPHQLENAILNLAINARDAMPDGGRLTIESRNAELDAEEAERHPGAAPGRYVCVRVVDSGTGMAPEVIERAFDPFFTTKPLGQGTGLGLSMIHGFAHQSNGFVRIDSALGEGSAIAIYLPGHDEGEAVRADERRPGQTAIGAGETILVIEDEQTVRDLVVEVLTEQGYVVLQASDGPTGLGVLRTATPIDLLVTDVGLPGLNGRQLADQARETRPHLKVLFITGYAEGAASPSGFLEPGMGILTKPFQLASLVSQVQAMMGAQVQP